MRYLPQALGLAVVGAGLVALPVAASPLATAASPDQSLVAQMQRESGSTATVTASSTGKVGFVRTAADLLPSVKATSPASAVAKATDYVSKYAGAFGATKAQLAQAGVHEDTTGWTVDYTQTYQGLPVFGSRLKAHVTKAGALTSVNGYVAPDLKIATTPTLGESDAAAKALRLVQAQPAGTEGSTLPKGYTDGLQIAKQALEVYQLGVIRGDAGESRLAWVIEVTNKSQIRETVVLDALTGKPLNRYSMVDNALDRTLIEAYDGEEDPEVVWATHPDDWGFEETEPPAWPTTLSEAHPGNLDDDQENELLSTAESYWMYMNTFGYDSYDGAGATMITVNNDPNIDCPNANWNGVSTNYCDGVSSDDTVSHEWGHAYTEYTSGLLYQWQPGAMNEAWSDIWGETADILNTRFNETPDEHRMDDTCSVHTPQGISVTINSPASAVGECQASPAGFGPEFTDQPVTADVVVATDAADDAGPTTTDGCSSFNNTAAVAGKWAFVDRGTCAFQAKVDHAIAAGATGIVIGNNTVDLPPSVAGVGGIYGLSVDQATGTRIKAAGTVNLSVEIDPSQREDNYRWLSGESDPAFGGAIRDMWMPTCYGDPGKVSDVEYQCSDSDNGGVHTNSGVVNHSYALLVDGGTYNGVTVPAIGLDKAANLYWFTQTNHLTPTSGFGELADALQASCTELIGQPINKVTLGHPTLPDGSDGAETPAAATPFTAADCAAVDAVIDAVELRTEPVRCDFQPMLAKDGVVGCGADFQTTSVYTEDFEGLTIDPEHPDQALADAGWTQDVTTFECPDPDVCGDYHGAVDFPWEATTDLPVVNPTLPAGVGEHSGTVAKGPDPASGGSCAGDDDDWSTANGLISPAITVPAGAAVHLTFDHYVATEVGWDGGNVKVSVNGGPFDVIDPSDYLFNAPGAVLSSLGAGNTDPLGGEPAFTGTDGGQPTGSWGTSVIDVQSLAKAGDTVKFKFDLGRDGCNGIDGWYIDDVDVSYCLLVPALAAKATSGIYGKQQGLEVTAAAEFSGKVTVTEGDKTLSTGSVKDGKGLIGLPADLPLGSHTVTVSYPGSATTLPSSTTATVTVVMTTSTVTPIVTSRIKGKGKKTNFKVTVVVTSPIGVVPTGPVTITKGKKKVGTGTLKADGTVVVKVKGKLKRKGTTTFTVTYAGDANLAGSSATFSVKSPKRK